MVIPYWLEKFLTLAIYERVSLAIQQVEAKTHAEIVPVIVRSSTPNSGIGLIIFVLVAVGVLLYSPILTTFLAVLSAAAALWYFREQELDKAVQARAQVEFFNLDVNQTQDRKGVLIFISVKEKRVVLVRDSSLKTKISTSDWDNLEQELQKGLKSKELGLSLIITLEKLGLLLAQVAPKQHLDIDEISNSLIIKE